jgi:hypothetical protein
MSVKRIHVRHGITPDGIRYESGRYQKGLEMVILLESQIYKYKSKKKQEAVVTGIIIDLNTIMNKLNIPHKSLDELEKEFDKE